MCHFNTSSPRAYFCWSERFIKCYEKWVKYAQNRPFLCNFNVCCYLIHSTFQNEICYMTCYQTYHFKMFTMGKLYNHRCVSKVYLYSHDISNRSMHNKRFIILKRVWRFGQYIYYWRPPEQNVSAVGCFFKIHEELSMWGGQLCCRVDGSDIGNLFDTHTHQNRFANCKTKCNYDSRI